MEKLYTGIKKEYMLAIGSISLVIAVFLDNFAGSGTIIDFFCGLFTGMSLTTNLFYLIRLMVENHSKATLKK